MKIQYTEAEIHQHVQLLYNLPLPVFVQKTEQEQLKLIDDAATLISVPNFPAHHCRQVVNLLQAIGCSSVFQNGNVKGRIFDYLESWQSELMSFTGESHATINP